MALVLLVQGCSTKQAASPSSGSLGVLSGVAPSQTKKPRSSAAHPGPRPGATPPQVPPTRPVALQTADDRPLAERTASEITGKYAVFTPGNDVLIVRRTDGEARSPALFEEAIALARARARLQSGAGLSGDLAQKVRITDGSVIIPFGPDTSPDRAADAISSVLAIDGVSQVRAVFTASR
jgi:hypothetical protein